jgi:hypothetical protein
VCRGERPHEERRKWFCNFSNTPLDVIRLHSIYMTYIDKGRAGLLDFPYWMSEVAELVDKARSKRDAKEADRDRSLDILEEAGIPTPRTIVRR